MIVAREVVGRVGRDQELEALGAVGGGELRNEIEPRALGDRIPLAARAIPHRETVVVLGDRARHLGPRVNEELRPLVRIEVAADPLASLGVTAFCVQAAEKNKTSATTATSRRDPLAGLEFSPYRINSFRRSMAPRSSGKHALGLSVRRMGHGNQDVVRNQPKLTDQPGWAITIRRFIG